MLTVMEAVVSPVLHSNVPGAFVDNVEVPQSFATDTTGVAGTAVGLAVPEPAVLVQPCAVCTTLYTPAVVTVMEGVVSPVFQSSVPIAFVLNVDVPQLLTTVTTGTSVVGTVITLVAVEMPQLVFSV